MNYIIFNTLLFLMLLIFLDSKEMQAYISEKEKQYILLTNILTCNTLYFLGIKALFLFFISILFVSAYIDYKYLEIPNIATIICLFTYVLSVFITPPHITFFSASITTVVYIFFVLGCILGLIGGGDIKILLPLFLILSESVLGLYIFLFLTSFTSVIFALPQAFKKRTLKVNTPMAMSFTIAFIFTASILN